MADPQAGLKAFEPKHEFFVGVDSDGCAFDTMEVKHKFCFAVAVLRSFGFAALAQPVRDVWDFVNLYSKTRGCNRWLALRATFEHLTKLTKYDHFKPFLAAHLDVIDEFVTAADEVESIHLSNDGLLLFAASKLQGASADLLVKCIVADPVVVSASAMGKQIVDAPADDEENCLIRLVYWTHLVNGLVALTVHNVPPFPKVPESLAKLAAKADVICVSATPYEALAREWEEHDIAQYATLICGQEQGKKAEHLCLAGGGTLNGKGGVAEVGSRYASSRVLMIGDAPGDMKAARANSALFYPINPGHEEASWARFYEEAADRFFNEEYAGDYEAQLVAEYDAYLPENPPWES